MTGQSEHKNIDRMEHRYIVIFATLAFLTVLTVAISYWHLTMAGAITVAIGIAVLKGSLVACYFMHLIDERRTIFWILILAAILLLCVLLLPVFGLFDAV